MEEDPFYSLEKTIKYSYRGLYLGAITGGVLSYLESEANNATLDTLLGIAAGGFRIGNTAGMLDNIVASKLHRPGSVAYVSKSGGLSNELKL